MVGVRHTIKMGSVRKMVEGPANVKRRKHIAAAVGRSLALMERHHKTKEMLATKGKGIAGAKPPRLYVRTSELIRSYRIHHVRGRLQGSYGSTLPRSKKLEDGGEIRAKKAGGFLAIPMPGVKGGPREHNNLVFLKTKAGGLYLGEPKGDLVNIMFTLKKSVNLPPRPTLANTAKKTDKKVTALIAAAVAKGFENG